MFLACQKSKVIIKLKFYYSNLKNAVETAQIAVDSCYVLRQFLTPLPSIDFREIRGLTVCCALLSCALCFAVLCCVRLNWTGCALLHTTILYCTAVLHCVTVLYCTVFLLYCY
jgi:hypothetical protein